MDEDEKYARMLQDEFNKVTAPPQTDQFQKDLLLAQQLMEEDQKKTNVDTPKTDGTSALDPQKQKQVCPFSESYIVNYFLFVRFI